MQLASRKTRKTRRSTVYRKPLSCVPPLSLWRKRSLEGLIEAAGRRAACDAHLPPCYHTGKRVHWAGRAPTTSRGPGPGMITSPTATLR